MTEAYVFELQHQHAKRIAVLLDVYAEDLDALVVEAREANIWRDLGGFYERRQEYAGFAHFFTRELISHTRASTISGLLTAEGIVTRCSPSCWPMRMNRGRLCQVSVSINGVSQREPDYNAIAIADVTGIEVYRGVPPADLSRSLVPNSSPSSIWEEFKPFRGWEQVSCKMCAPGSGCPGASNSSSQLTARISHLCSRFPTMCPTIVMT